ncbi:Lipid A export ATP-binding/permease protein MsbA [Grifola frondosa]|uniref:Lipid A export ATP-binding/permease protein MsbA n=1 Tax=Grifola frondosa TaxID=5627 RepID=A0A1C7MQA1_GRIFR|nr:Lipid A export ATP-binding/permease protein MsbA [Grifola frondosa]
MKLRYMSLWQDPLRELPQIVFTLRAVQYPSSMPVSLASLNLIQQTTLRFTLALYGLFQRTGSVAKQLAAVRRLYEVAKIPNRVVDGAVPFPEDAQNLVSGVSLEFRNVSFKYPGAENFAIRNVSFKLAPGQLCVIVGANGSGKSTILKLIVRLYDPEEGQIFVNGLDIRTLKLFDLRQAISVLFQDYTHFPLSIRDNIALGDPSNFRDDERVYKAAKLGGAEQFIERLSDGFHTYLERPVRDYYAGLPEGTHTLFGRDVNYSAVREQGAMTSTNGPSLSGGQMQRLAVSRTFMRSIVSEDAKVGLLLFDEPSASLDPTAEHDLFARLRELRGSKTMLFSSHRFGSLTRHADLILYMNNSVIVEAGTHDELLKKEGEYARIWMLQAQAFL